MIGQPATAAPGADPEPPGLHRVRHDWEALLAAVCARRGLAGVLLRQTRPEPVRMDPDGLLHISAPNDDTLALLIARVDLDLAAELTARYGRTVHVRITPAPASGARPAGPR